MKYTYIPTGIEMELCGLRPVGVLRYFPFVYHIILFYSFKDKCLHINPFPVDDELIQNN